MSRNGLPAPEDKTEFVRSMFDRIAARYDVVNSIVTFGLDRRWRQRTVRSLGLARGATVIDLGSGTGVLLDEAVRAGHYGVGIDLSFGMLAAARHASPRLQADASRLPIRSASVDGVLSGFALRNFTEPGVVLAEVARVLRPGGSLAILEIGVPQSFGLRFAHRLWFERAIPMIGAMLSDADAYRYLPRSVVYLPAPAEFAAMLDRLGFVDVGHRQLSGGLAQVVVARRAAT